MIIINKSFVLERSRIIFFFSVSSMRSYILGHHSLFSICGFLIFQKKDKYVFWKFKQMTIFEVLVFHKDSSSNADSISSSEKTGRGISFELRHPFLVEIIATPMSFLMPFSSIFTHLLGQVCRFVEVTP